MSSRLRLFWAQSSLLPDRYNIVAEAYLRKGVEQLADYVEQQLDRVSLPLRQRESQD